MGIVDEDVVKVRDATDLDALVGSYLQLRRVGRRSVGLCPFHDEKTPSFSVNSELGFYKCFGCGKSGDAITFVREIENLDFVGAVEYLAHKAGIPLRYTSRGEGVQRKKRAELVEAVEAAVEWYHQRLLVAEDASRARGYLRSRGLDGNLVREYRLGWAPDEWDALYRGIAVSNQAFLAAGLGFVNRADRVQDHFRSRVLFPIFDVNGAAVGFGGRVLPGDEGSKYKNSFDSAIYNKSKLLYGLHLAKEEIVRADESIVCEGYTDVIGFGHVGLRRAVATCGTALTEDHVKLLKRFGRRILLAFDADAAGQQAAQRIYQWEKALEVDVAVVSLPSGVDPGELAWEAPTELLAAVETAKPFLGFRLDRVLGDSDLSSPEGRARAAERAVSVVNEHPSDIVRDQYLMQVGDLCNIDVERLRALATSSAPLAESGSAKLAPRSGSIGASVRLRDSVETQILMLCLHRPEEIPEYVVPNMFSDQLLRRIFVAILESPVDDLSSLLDSLDDQAADALGQLAVMAPPEVEVGRVVGQFLHDAAVRLVQKLQREVQRNPDPQLMPLISQLRLLIPQIREAGFDLGVAALLVPLLDD